MSSSTLKNETNGEKGNNPSHCGSRLSGSSYNAYTGIGKFVQADVLFALQGILQKTGHNTTRAAKAAMELRFSPYYIFKTTDTSLI